MVLSKPKQDKLQTTSIGEKPQQHLSFQSPKHTFDKKNATVVTQSLYCEMVNKLVCACELLRAKRVENYSIQPPSYHFSNASYGLV